MKEKFTRFMYGRYGNDRFNQFLMIVALVALVLSALGVQMFYVIGIVLMIYSYFRMFSKQIHKRAAENQKYNQKEFMIKGFFKKKKKEMEQLKTHHIYKCPSCKQKIRVPRGKGKIIITCSKCKHEFIKNS